jgi:hypothetical protein
MGSSCGSPEVEAQGVTQFVGTQEFDSLVGRKASNPIGFSPSRIPFFRVSPCCDRRSQLTPGAFSFPIPQVSHFKPDFPAPAFLQRIRPLDIIHWLDAPKTNRCAKGSCVQGDRLKAKQLPKIAKISIPNRSLLPAACVVAQSRRLPCPSSM